MAEKTKAQKAAQARYMEKFAVARIRIPTEEYKAIQDHAKQRGESVNTFVRAAIAEKIDRDNGNE